jgi:hypothetical protein
MSAYYHIKKHTYNRPVWVKKVPQKAEKRPKNVTKVILITSNPRSGSSFTGEILTAMPMVSYFFEPLWFFSRPNKSEEANMSKVSLYTIKTFMCLFWLRE